MRRLAVLLLALALPAVALAADTDPQKRFTAADQAKARALLLKRTDFVAGWKQQPTKPDDDDVKCAAFDPDYSDLVLTGDQRAEFAHAQGGASVYSYASLYKSAAHASAAWSRSAKPALLQCLREAMREAVGPDVKLTFSKLARVPFPKLAPRVYAVEVDCTMSSPQTGRSVRLSMDVVVLGRGRAEASVMTMGVGAGIGNDDVRAFARLVAGRLAAARL